MNYKVIVFVLLFIVQGTFAQQQTRADRYFAKGDYINAAENYKLDLEKGSSKIILERLAESYYNIYEYKRAVLYLTLYINGKYPEEDKTYDNRFNFMMYQLRSALGDHEGAVTYLAAYAKENDKYLDTSIAIKEIEEFKIKDEDYIIKKSKLSSSFSDFGAVQMDSVMYFVSDRSKNSILDKNYNWTHRPFLDIFEAKVSEKGRLLTLPEPIDIGVNSKLHEGNFCFSADRKTFYFSRSNSEKGKKKFDTLNTNQVYLYKIVKDSVWGTPEKLPINVAGYSMMHPSLSTDGRKLYFSSNIPGGHGSFDLYYVEVHPEGTYGSPVNLGDVINTAHREQFPFVSKEHHLFFASNGHFGLGMLDLFVSENVKNAFTKPVNLGAPINSQYEDFSISYSNDKKGFFSSNRSLKNDDIYSFEQIGEIFVKEYIANFEVRDINTKDYVPNADVTLLNMKQQPVYKNVLDTTAAFTLNILPGTYQFSAKAPGYLDGQEFARVIEKEGQTYILYLNKMQETTNTPNEAVQTAPKTKEDVLQDLLADTVGPQVVERDGKLFFDLPPIYFDYDKWTITADSRKVLDEFALKLERYKSVYIKISSHTDNRGSASYNEALSEKRAESTRNYLALVGYVNARRMKFQGFGESVPIIDCGVNCSQEEHQLNRRSEFEITGY